MVSFTPLLLQSKFLFNPKYFYFLIFPPYFQSTTSTSLYPFPPSHHPCFIPLLHHLKSTSVSTIVPPPFLPPSTFTLGQPTQSLTCFHPLHHHPFLYLFLSLQSTCLTLALFCHSFLFNPNFFPHCPRSLSVAGLF